MDFLFIDKEYNTLKGTHDTNIWEQCRVRWRAPAGGPEAHGVLDGMVTECVLQSKGVSYNRHVGSRRANVYGLNTWQTLALDFGLQTLS